MSENTRIWLAASYAAPFRTGGWAFVRSAAGAVTGMAGGDRRITAERLALSAILAALKDGSGPVELIAADPLIVGVPQRLEATGDDAPTEDLDLWAQVATAFRSRPVRLVRQAPAPGKPLAFAAAWAEQSRERAKNGAFAFPIPKPNLAKAGA